MQDPCEAVAVVAHIPSPHDPLHVYAMQDEGVDVVQGDSTVQSLMAKITALANPDKKRWKGLKGTTPIYEQAQAGKSHYPHISGWHWDCLNIRWNFYYYSLLLSIIYLYPSKSDRLENHLATVVEFLWKCAKASDNGMAVLLHTFHHYMVASCWMKMGQWITHRYSEVMFNLLNTLKPQDMQNFFQKFASQVKPGLWKDSNLTGMLVHLEQQGLLWGILQVQLNSTNAKGLVNGLLAKLASQTQQGLCAYNKHTCFIFHALLIATICGFWNNLKLLKGNEDAKSHEKHANQVLQFGCLLWQIAYSQMLTYHLQLLEVANFLHSPVDTNMQYIKDDTSLAAGHPTDGDKDEDKNEDKNYDMATDVEHRGARPCKPWSHLQIPKVDTATCCPLGSAWYPIKVQRLVQSWHYSHACGESAWAQKHGTLGFHHQHTCFSLHHGWAYSPLWYEPIQSKYAIDMQIIQWHYII